MAARERVRGLVDSRRFQYAITTLIIVNAITLGCETSPSLVRGYGGLFHVVDRVVLSVFALELALRLYAHRLRFFKDSWSCFDAVTIVIALIPHAGGFSVLRALRILRTLRLISLVPSLRRVGTALAGALPAMASVTGLLALIHYVAAVMGTKLFGATAPQHFGTLGDSAFTLFQIMTADGWSEIARDVMTRQPFAWIFFVVYILVSAFVVLNLFIAITVNAMEPHVLGEIHDDLERLEEREQRTDALILEELRALSVEVASLRARVDEEPPARTGRRPGRASLRSRPWAG
ncbi:ion transporter [Thermomonospora umbrina]|uniref:Voltage-gated sodium channel n=1 Tax=Thermomonospora umbrina TaxID=111806 RepID=A0A3D9SVV2_9ACTN|nr:ion transporter [Thermomonospora umbrina]REE96704.1 voltage-gated sodium channel [Thermomonospora umbrina]